MNPEHPVPPVRSSSDPILVEKRPYSSPTLREYGPVSKLTMTGNGTGGDGGSAGMQMACARRLKARIVKVGEHSPGISLYLFVYRPKHQHRHKTQRHLGVMADEVEKVAPSAVSTGGGGYKSVD